MYGTMSCYGVFVNVIDGFEFISMVSRQKLIIVNFQYHRVSFQHVLGVQYPNNMIYCVCHEFRENELTGI